MKEQKALPGRVQYFLYALDPGGALEADAATDKLKSRPCSNPLPNHYSSSA